MRNNDVLVVRATNNLQPTELSHTCETFACIISCMHYGHIFASKKLTVRLIKLCASLQ